MDWSPDGRSLLVVHSGGAGEDLWVLPMEGERKPVPFLQTNFNENQGRFSPDGKWVAYTSDESGRYEVYVRPFPSGSSKWRVSPDGGELPHWRGDGKEIYYLTPDRKLMAAAVNAGRDGLTVSVPQQLFSTQMHLRPSGAPLVPYDISSDGKKFLMDAKLADQGESALTVVVNWLGAVKK